MSTDPSMPVRNPQIGDTVTLKPHTVFSDDKHREGVVVEVADDGRIMAEFRQPPHPPMTVTSPPADFVIVGPDIQPVRAVLEKIRVAAEQYLDTEHRSPARDAELRENLSDAALDAALVLHTAGTNQSLTEGGADRCDIDRRKLARDAIGLSMTPREVEDFIHFLSGRAPDALADATDHIRDHRAVQGRAEGGGHRG